MKRKLQELTTKNAVILLGPSPLLIDRTIQYGLKALVVDTPDTLRTLPRTDAFRAYDELVETLTAESIVESALQWIPSDQLAGAIGLTERHLILAAQINHLIGAIDNPVEVVRRTVDKTAMRSHLSNSDELVVLARVVHDRDELRRFMVDHSLPEAIVKPHEGTGSAGVSRVVLHDLENQSISLPALAEELLVGPEYSVEMFSADGHHYPIGVTEQLPGPAGTDLEYIEMGHRFPSTTANKGKIVSSTISLLQRLGVTEGLTHTEIIVTAQGVRPVETHTRNAGDRIVDLIRLSRGIDLMEVALLRRIGGDWRRALTPTATSFAQTRFLRAAPGTVTQIAGWSRARLSPGIVDGSLSIAVGNRVEAIGSSAGRHGQLIACASTESACGLQIEEAMRMIEISVAE